MGDGGALMMNDWRQSIRLRFGDPGRIRTCNPQSRNLMLYPVELRDRLGPPGFWGGLFIYHANMKNLVFRQA